MQKKFNPEPTKDVSYRTLLEDEKVRKEHPVTIPKSQRFGVASAPNGNLRVIVPDIDDESARKSLSPMRRANTNTHTVFNTDRVYEIHDNLADKVSSPKFKSNAFKLTGHIAMMLTAAKDPRQQHVHPAARPQVGPGTYDVDPLGDRTTGMAKIEEGKSHHMVNYAKDKARPSPAFKGPERGEAVVDINEEKSRGPQVAHMLPPDYDVWGAKGFFSPKQPRVIASERWGRSVREPRAPSKDMSQEIIDPQITASGAHGTMTAYSKDPHTRAYKAAFGSGLPRLVGLPPAGKDTRFVAKSQEKAVGTPANLGPGAYALEPPRFRSWHAALADADPYYSLASGAPKFIKEDPEAAAAAPASPAGAARGSASGSAQQQLPGGAGGRTLRASAPLIMMTVEPAAAGSAPASPAYAGPLAAGAGGLASPSAAAASPSGRHGGLLPGRDSSAGGTAAAPVVDVDWLVHQALVNAQYSSVVDPRYGAAPVGAGGASAAAYDEEEEEQDAPSAAVAGPGANGTGSGGFSSPINIPSPSSASASVSLASHHQHHQQQGAPVAGTTGAAGAPSALHSPQASPLGHIQNAPGSLGLGLGLGLALDLGLGLDPEAAAAAMAALSVGGDVSPRYIHPVPSPKYSGSGAASPSTYDSSFWGSPRGGGGAGRAGTAASAGKYDGLSFLTRAVPHVSGLKSHLTVTADLRKARAEARAATAPPSPGKAGH